MPLYARKLRSFTTGRTGIEVLLRGRSTSFQLLEKVPVFFLNQENLISWVSKCDVRGGKIKHRIIAAVETVFLALGVFERLFPHYYQRRLLLTAQSMV